MQISTYVPYSESVTAMIRNGFDSLSPLESVIITVELFAFGITVLCVAVRLFRYGSIEYLVRRAFISGGFSKSWNPRNRWAHLLNAEVDSRLRRQ